MGKFKLNWGWSLVIVFAIFMTTFLYFFYVSFQELKTNELVVKDYYEQELKYGDVLAKKKNADSMSVEVQIVNNKDGLSVIFPAYINREALSGEIFLYKPDRKKLDKKISIKLDSTNLMRFPKSDFVSGRWDVSIDWKINEVPYFKEEKLTIN